MFFLFLPLPLAGEIGCWNKKGERRCKQRWEAEGPFEQALTFTFPSGGSLWRQCQPLLLWRLLLVALTLLPFLLHHQQSQRPVPALCLGPTLVRDKSSLSFISFSICFYYLGTAVYWRKAIHTCLLYQHELYKWSYSVSSNNLLENIF